MNDSVNKSLIRKDKIVKYKSKFGTRKGIVKTTGVSLVLIEHNNKEEFVEYPDIISVEDSKN